IKFVARGLPFKLGRQPHLAPFGKGRRFVKRYVADGCIERQLFQTTEREMKPLAISVMPVKRRSHSVLIYPVPPFRMPQSMISISTVLNEFKVFQICYELIAYLKIVQINLMPRKLIVETKSVAGEADLVNSTF